MWLDVVVANSPQRGIVAHRAEGLLQVHLRTYAAASSHVLQPAPFFDSDYLPPIQRGVVRAERARHGVCLTAVADYAILIEYLCAFGDAHGTPVAATLAVLTAVIGDLPIS